MQQEDVSSNCILTCQQQNAAITVFVTTFGSLNEISKRTRIRNCWTHRAKVGYVRYVTGVYVLCEVHVCIVLLCVVYCTIHKICKPWQYHLLACRTTSSWQSAPIETSCRPIKGTQLAVLWACPPVCAASEIRLLKPSGHATCRHALRSARPHGARLC